MNTAFAYMWSWKILLNHCTRLFHLQDLTALLVGTWYICVQPAFTSGVLRFVPSAEMGTHLKIVLLTCVLLLVVLMQEVKPGQAKLIKRTKKLEKRMRKVNTSINALEDCGKYTCYWCMYWFIWKPYNRRCRGDNGTPPLALLFHNVLLLRLWSKNWKFVMPTFCGFFMYYWLNSSLLLYQLNY